MVQMRSILLPFRIHQVLPMYAPLDDLILYIWVDLHDLHLLRIQIPLDAYSGGNHPIHDEFDPYFVGAAFVCSGFVEDFLLQITPR